MLRENRIECGYRRTLLVVLGLSFWPSVMWPQIRVGPPQDVSAVTVQLRTVGEKLRFHRGELIWLDLTYSSDQHKKYWVEFGCNDALAYHIEPPTQERFTDEVYVCSPFSRDVDLAVEPIHEKRLFNRQFDLKPGKYRISVTSSKLGSPIDSNKIDFEVLPPDPVWEKQEFERAITLLPPTNKSGNGDGITILEYLGTDDANLELARQYAGQGRGLERPLLTARDLAAVLEVLESGLQNEDRVIDDSYLRTLAKVSLLAKNPDWYSIPGDAGDYASRTRALYEHRAELRSEELRYAGLLLQAAARKEPEVRIRTLETFLYARRQGSGITLSPEDWQRALAQIPALFGQLPNSDQTNLLHSEWPEIKSPAMIPVLKKIIEDPRWLEPREIALRRLHELSPSDARPYIMSELRKPVSSVGAGVLGLIPEKELPGFDGVMLERVKESVRQDDGWGLVQRSAILERFASSSIAGEIAEIVADLTKTDCRASANLLAYLLRASPDRGAELLRKQMEIPTAVGCSLLRTLAEVRMSPEVEAEALRELDSGKAENVSEALLVLRRFGGVTSRQAIMQHYERWRSHWRQKASELEKPENQAKRNIEGAYFLALTAAQGWVTGEDEIARLKEQCLSKQCKEPADSMISSIRNHWEMIKYSEPAGDDFQERFGFGRYEGIGTLERLKQKLAQYPKGTAFQIDGRGKGTERLQQISSGLNEWAASNGYEIHVYQEQ